MFWGGVDFPWGVVYADGAHGALFNFLILRLCSLFSCLISATLTFLLLYLFIIFGFNF